MNGPLRFKDDPNFKLETGCDLSAESDLAGQYDLSGMREAVMADIGSGGAASATTAFQITVLGGLFAVLVGGAGIWWMMQGDLTPDPGTAAAVSFAVDPSEEPAPELSPELEAAVAYAVEPEDLEEPVAEVEAPPVVEAVEPAPAVAEEPVAEGVENDGVADAVVRPKPASSFQAPQGGSLAQENDVYEAVQTFMAQRDYDKARSAMALYLKNWPDGVHVDGTLMTMLECMYQQSRYGEAERLAELLVGVPTLAHRHAEIARVRAESLVMLNRCEEAIEVATKVERNVATAIKQQCRKAKRAQP